MRVRNEVLKIQPIILAGGLRDTPLENALGVPLLSLPLQPDRCVAELWADVLATFDHVRFPIRIITSSRDKCEQLFPMLEDQRFRLHTDPFPHRGTGGVLADIRVTLPEIGSGVSYFLVLDQSSCPPKSLESFVAKLSDGADIVIGVSSFDRLTGILAFKPEVLDLVPGVGYQDFKEQTLVRARDLGLRIAAHTTMAEAVRIDHLNGVLDAVRYWASSDSGRRYGIDGAIEGSCSIHDSVKADEAMIVDSICMKGSVIGTGAVVARSIIGPNVRIPRGIRVIDSVVDATRKFNSQGLEKRR